MQEHISYEYAMMNIVGDAWMNSGSLTPDIVNNMCNIVAYNTAQNLAWYIIRQGNTEVPTDIHDILDKILDQIITLDHDRTSLQNEKLQPEDFKYLRDWINKHKDKLNIGD